ncbi:MAG: bifunctional phosphoribosylaminoimidazolecarboxamide formyltransferase/IMP cyclohydrolase [Planctomycetota bacterium]
MPPTPVRRALLSVHDKTGLVDFASALVARGVELLSTGGTAKALRAAGLAVKDVSDETGFPEMLDGRVKTLHPRVHGALLGLRDDDKHRAQMAEHGIGAIDLLVVNLYPFEATVMKPRVTLEEAIEQIDIGGPAMLRSAAKNHRSVGVVTDPSQYATVLEDLKANGGALSEELKAQLARVVFARTSAYDAAIHQFLAGRGLDPMPLALGSAWRATTLRYGENPHQAAALYVDPRAPRGSLAKALFRNGKELSFNNYLDADAAWGLARGLEAPAAVVVKHNNPCGVATAADPAAAFEAALACDPRSAFGGIVAFNRPLTEALARRLASGDTFLEVVVAPGVEAAAVQALVEGPRWGKNLRILDVETTTPTPFGFDVRAIDGGLLVQQRDTELVDPKGVEVATKRAPTEAEKAALFFAYRVVQHVRSNAIVVGVGTQAVGVGAGQMSRVEATELAIHRAKRWAAEGARSLDGAVLASDAFFPFNDALETAISAGVRAVIQPGGSKNDEAAVALCNAHGVAMILAGHRHFRH